MLRVNRVHLETIVKDALTIANPADRKRFVVQQATIIVLINAYERIATMQLDAKEFYADVYDRVGLEFGFEDDAETSAGLENAITSLSTLTATQIRLDPLLRVGLGLPPRQDVTVDPEDTVDYETE